MMDLQVLGALTLVVCGLIYVVYTQRRVDSGGPPAPPVVPSWIPWLGNVVQIASGGDAFFDKVSEKYGPIYKLLTLGDRRIYITSPQAISYIYKQAKTFEFHPIRMDFQNRIFGMSANAAHSPAMIDRVFPMHHKLLSPIGIGELVMRNAVLAEATLRKAAEELPEGGNVVELTDIVFDMVYSISAVAYLGKTFPAKESIAPFHRFDKGFPVLSLSLPSFMTRGPQQAREDMIALISDWWAKDGVKAMGDVPAITREMMEICDVEGFNLYDRSSLLLGELWALEANAPYAAMWTLSHILRTPTLIEALRSEASKAISSMTPPKLSTLLRLPAAQLPPLVPLLSSCIQETLRLCTSSFSIRRVAEDAILPPNICGNGIGKHAGLSLKKDEILICQTRQSHLDTDGWGHNASTWRAERFLDKDGVKAVKGQMSPFGGGVSMCEGRHFAQSEITIFLVAFIQLFDIALVPGGDTLEADTQRMGLGILHRKGGMKVELSRR